VLAGGRGSGLGVGDEAVRRGPAQVRLAVVAGVFASTRSRRYGVVAAAMSVRDRCVLSAGCTAGRRHAASRAGVAALGGGAAADDRRAGSPRRRADVHKRVGGMAGVAAGHDRSRQAASWQLYTWMNPTARKGTDGSPGRFHVRRGAGGLLRNG